ncbi:MAG: hypothetical protein KKD44_27315 [Proteobacteria bacterium]|nr:hypothetical protein [Pseudomonadota bacterium]
MEESARALADDLRGGGLKHLVFPGTAAPLVIRKVLLIEVLELGLLPTILPADLPAEEAPSRAEKFRQEATETKTEEWTIAKEKALRFGLLRLGMVSPHFWDGSPQDTPEGAIHYSDMAEHVDWAVSQVIAHSSLAQGVPDLAPFPSVEPSGDAGQDGAEIRPATE